jgi:hypothetical protein
VLASLTDCGASTIGESLTPRVEYRFQKGKTNPAPGQANEGYELQGPQILPDTMWPGMSISEVYESVDTWPQSNPELCTLTWDVITGTNESFVELFAGYKWTTDPYREIQGITEKGMLAYGDNNKVYVNSILPETWPFP